ncbi:hypothetical protein RIF29_06761 [Crotalaria pallida]|uniref:Uncharacterized protein n=1 Tax=Crotalaria pallida TaxID=3830 RepID=A0AAN9J3H3_CROPI
MKADRRPLSTIKSKLVREVVLALPAIVRCSVCQVRIEVKGIPENIPNRLCKECEKKSSKKQPNERKGGKPLSADSLRKISSNMKESSRDAIDDIPETSFNAQLRSMGLLSPNQEKNAADDRRTTYQEDVADFARGIRSSSNALNWVGTGTRRNIRDATSARKKLVNGLIDHLDGIKLSDQPSIFVKLISYKEERVRNLPRPYLCCRPSLSIEQLIQYVAREASLQTEEAELYVVKECPADIIGGEATFNPNNHTCQILADGKATLDELKIDNLNHGYLVIAYKKKMWDLNEAWPTIDEEGEAIA